MAYTPMMQQYFKVKEENKDCIIFYRLGDFYEMFFDDAIIASKVLEIALTGRDCGMEERAPMCGVPFHSANSYINKLISKGYKVAICEQLSDPKLSKGIVERGIVRIVTPGTIIEEEMLDQKSNNFLGSIARYSNFYALCLCDVSTGDMKVCDYSGRNALNSLLKDIIKYNLSEIVCEDLSILGENDNIGVSISIVNKNEYIEYEKDIAQKFGSIKKYSKSQIFAIGILFKYLQDTQKNGLEHITDIEIIDNDEYMYIDDNARIHLELFSSIGGDKSCSLLSLIDKTKTSMGARLLKNWLNMPLINKDKIFKRQQSVEELKEDVIISQKIDELFSCVYDIERIISKLTYNTLNARDCISLKKSIEVLPHIKESIKNFSSPKLKEIYDSMDTMEDIFNLIDLAIIDEPPLSIKEGNIIKPSFNDEIQSLYNMCNNSNDILIALEEAEKQNTGIKNLKLGYNKIFGYYFEVTKSYYDKVPYRYVRKQTLANCERFITDELKDIETKITYAKENRIRVEYAIFEQIRKSLIEQIIRFQRVSNQIATIDCLNSLATIAITNFYNKPIIIEDGEIKIEQGKHPMVENKMGFGFVANDCYLDNKTQNFAIITGPNMAGKSTYMRQVAIITLLAHMGSFVPAKSAIIPITDKIFTRIGASDNVSQGKSTFMVEMCELANIINNATNKSLIVLDEIGRGTSTIDGVSIAMATVIHITNKIKAKTLFATHYHQLSNLEGQIDGVVNYKIAVKEQGEDVVFLHSIMHGGTDKSFGIYVAKLAGLPNSFIDTAKSVMEKMGDVSTKHINYNTISEQSILNNDNDKYEKIKNKLKELDINNLTPIMAFDVLAKLIESVK